MRSMCGAGAGCSAINYQSLGSQMGGSRAGSQRGSQRGGQSWRTMSEYSDEVIGPSFWGAVTTICEKTSTVWNRGSNRFGRVVGELICGGIVGGFALFCILNILHQMPVLGFLASYLSKGVLGAFAQNANMTEICPPCDACCPQCVCPIQTCCQFN